MRDKNETPAGSLAGVSKKRLDTTSASNLTLSVYRAQHLIAAWGLRPDLGVMLAALGFGGHSHG